MELLLTPFTEPDLWLAAFGDRHAANLATRADKHDREGSSLVENIASGGGHFSNSGLCASTGMRVRAPSCSPYRPARPSRRSEGDARLDSNTESGATRPRGPSVSGRVLLALLPWGTRATAGGARRPGSLLEAISVQ
jgi:hypothetical protein